MEPLSPTMQHALNVIRTHRVTYWYLPMPRSVNRPRPATSRGLTPAYSHGLNASTVEKLIELGLVFLSPYSKGHGRVLVVDTEES